MELLLGGALAVSIVALAWIQSVRAVERARTRRLEDELSSLRRAPVSPPPGPLGPSVADAAPSLEDEREKGASRPPEEGAVPEVSLAARSEDASGAPEPSPGRRPPEGEGRSPLGPSVFRLARALREMGPPLASLDAAARRVPAPPEEPESALLEPVARPVAEEEPFSSAVRTAEEMADERARLADDLRSVGQALDRALEGSRAAESALEQVARQAAAFPGLAAALSGLADRTNLLALNLALHAARSGDDGPSAEEAAAEMRGIFEEARRLAREVTELARRTGAWADKSTELFADVSAAAAAGDERGRRARTRVTGLEALGARLGAALEASVDAARRKGEEDRALARRVEATAAALAVRAAGERARHLREEELRAHALEAIEGLRELRDAAREVVETAERGAPARPPARPA